MNCLEPLELKQPVYHALVIFESTNMAPEKRPEKRLLQEPSPQRYSYLDRFGALRPVFLNSSIRSVSSRTMSGCLL